MSWWKIPLHHPGTCCRCLGGAAHFSPAKNQPNSVSEFQPLCCAPRGLFGLKQWCWWVWVGVSVDVVLDCQSLQTGGFSTWSFCMSSQKYPLANSGQGSSVWEVSVRDESNFILLFEVCRTITEFGQASMNFNLTWFLWFYHQGNCDCFLSYLYIT